MMPNPAAAGYHHHPPADFAPHPHKPHTHHSSSSRAEGRRYRGERPSRERNIPPPWPTSPAGSHATSADYYGVHELGGGGYYPPPPPSSSGHYPYAPGPPLPRHVPPAATPPTISNAPSPAPAHNLPPKLPSGVPPAPPPPPTISPPPPIPYGGVDQYSHYPPPPHHPHDPHHPLHPHHPHNPHHPPPAHHYYPPPLHPLDEYGAPPPDYHHPRGHRDPRDRDYTRPPPRDRNYSIPPPMMDEYSIPPVPPPPPLGGYSGSRRESRDYGGHPRGDYMPPPLDDYPPPDPRDYGPPRGGDYRLPRDPYAPRDYSMEPDYHHPDSREYRRPKSEYEVEYQSAPPSRGQPSLVSSAVTRDDDGDEYSSIPPPPKELEYDGPARKEIEYPGSHARARSRARSIKEIEYHASKSRAASRAPSMAPSTRDPREVREIEYPPRSQSIPPPPPPPGQEGRRDLDYYDAGSEHPPSGVREIEYLPRPGTNHSKRGSDLGPAPLVARPPDPAIATTPHWPPPRDDPELDPKDAADLISNGTPLFRGNIREIVGSSRGNYSFFVSAGNEWDEDTDCAAFQEAVYGDMSSAPTQDKALERPAMCHTFGRYPGTVTLSCYVAGFSSTWRAGVNDMTGTELSLQSTGGGRIKVRKLSMIYVVDRLRNLQDRGIEENEPTLLHDHIYNFLLYEPPRPNQNGYSIETQISDLISALLRPSWIDFSLSENQVVSRFLRSTEPGVTNAFFHQLLLALELYLRIGVVRPQTAIAEKVSWDLVLAQRWLENVEIQPPKVAKEGSSSVSFGFKNKESQVDALKEFAWTLKWPNMHEVNYTLTEEDSPSDVLEDRSTACMAWFTGLILPGSSMPFILMNALTDCDPDTLSSFHDLPCTTPNVGFQYRGHTYWSWECIVGKVLGAAKGVSQIAGWLGPCISSPDLDRAEVAYINQRKPPGNSIIKLSAADVRNMQAASDPLGPKSMGNYKTVDYDLIIPDSTQQTDTIRIERLNFTQAAPLVMDSPGGTSVHPSAAGTMLEEVFSPLSAPANPIPPLSLPSERQLPQNPPPPPTSSILPIPGGGAARGIGLGLAHLPLPNSTTGGSLATTAPHVPRAQSPKAQASTFDASITFAIRHRSWKVNLRYDTPFIAAYPCSNGPHVLYNKYYYRAVKVDSLVEIENWGPKMVRAGESSSGSGGERVRRMKHKPRAPPARGRKGSRHPNATRSEDEEESCSESDLSEEEESTSASYASSPSRSESDEEEEDEDGFSHLSPRHHPHSHHSHSSQNSDSPPEHLTLNNTLDEVLVVEAFGVHDNEVFARAWCSFWGVSALVADLRRTCFACCVREAYAVGVAVVVVVDGQAEARKVGEEEVEEVDRMMEGLYV